jgi:hypothetical protein
MAGTYTASQSNLKLFRTPPPTLVLNQVPSTPSGKVSSLSSLLSKKKDITARATAENAGNIKQ